MKSNKYLGYKAFALLALLALVSSHSAFAGSISNCTGGSGDYSDAPSSYGVACHDTNRWQQLGNSDASLFGDSISTNDNNNVGWTSESAPNAVDSGDNGVSWATSTDGITWSNFNQSNDLVQGEFVKFQVDVQRSAEGNHKYDEYKLWLDWFGNDTFNETDVVMNGSWMKNEDSDGVEFTGTLTSNFYNNDLQAFNSPDEFGSFFSNAIQVPINSILGELWMRARVICENSLNTSSVQLLATGYYHQGEVEDYALNVVNKVSEPGTAILFSTVLLGLMLRRKKHA